MAQEITIKINAEGNIQGIDKAIKSLKELDSVAGQASKKASTSLGGLGSTMTSLGGAAGRLIVPIGAAIASVTAIGYAASEAFEAFVNSENAMKGLATVAKNAGEDFDKVKEAVTNLTSDGLIPMEEATRGIKTLLSTGLSLEESVNLFKALKDIAAFNRQSFYSLGEAVNATIDGIKNGNSTLSDAVGETENLSSMQKKYAASLGTTVDKLTEFQKIQAANVGFLKSGQKFLGDSTKLTDSLSGSTSRLSAAYQRLKVAIGAFLFDNEFVKKSLKTLGDIAVSIADKLEKFSKSKSFAGTKEDQVKSLTERLGELKSQLESVPKGLDLTAKGLANIEKNSIVKEIRDTEQAIAKLNKEIAKQKDTGIAGLRQADAAKTATIFNKIQNDQKRVSEEQAKMAQESAKKAADELKKLEERYKNFSTSRIKQLENQRDEELKIAQGNAALIVKINQNYNKQIQNEREKDKKDFEQKEKEKAEFAKKIFDELEKIKSGSGIFEDLSIDRITKSTRVAISGSFEGFFDTMADLDGKVKDVESRVGRKLNAQEISDLRRASIQATAKTTAETISQGAEGARKMIVGLGKTAINAIAPGMGEAAGPLLDAFSQGPEATKKMVQDFTSAIPMIIENMIESIPVFLETLADSLPLVIERLAEKADDIALALIKAMPRVVAKLILLIPQIIVAFAKEMPKAAVEFIKGLVSGAGRFVQELINKLTGSSGSNNAGPLGKIPVVGPIISGAIGGIKKIFKFADGGSIYAKQVPSGFPSDSFPARLTSGELVVDRSTAYKLKEFLDDPRMTQPSSDSGLSTALLSQIASLLARPMTIESDVSLDERAFAKILLELNRTNQRLA